MSGFYELKKVLDENYKSEKQTITTVATITSTEPLECKNSLGEFKEMYVLYQFDLLRTPKTKKVTGKISHEGSHNLQNGFVEPTPFKIGDLVLLLIVNEFDKQKVILIDKIIQK